MAFLELYLDESGHSSKHKFVTVAGYIGHAEEWAGFATEWNSALLDAGVVERDGRVGEFHMTDCESFHGLFKGWTSDQRKALLGRLMGIIGSRRLHVVGCVVSVDWWKTFDWANSPFGRAGLKPLADPYHLALQNVVMAAIVALTNDPRNPDLMWSDGVACVIAEQGQFSRRAVIDIGAIAAGLMETNKGKIVTVTLGSAATMPQLQAADIAAFELRWRFTKPDLNRWPISQIFNSGRGILMGFPQGLLVQGNLPNPETIRSDSEVRAYAVGTPINEEAIKSVEIATGTKRKPKRQRKRKGRT